MDSQFPIIPSTVERRYGCPVSGPICLSGVEETQWATALTALRELGRVSWVTSIRSSQLGQVSPLWLFDQSARPTVFIHGIKRLVPKL